MRILFLSQVLPYPLDAGPKLRSYFVLRHLAKKHKVTLLTFVRDTDRPQDIAHLQEFCHAVHTVSMHRTAAKDVKFLVQSVLAQKPFLIVRDQHQKMSEKIKAVMQQHKFDVVHADQLWMAQYALAAKKEAPEAKIILDQHNAVYLIPGRLAENESNPVKRLILAREAQVMTKYEVDVCRKFNHVVWVTGEDQQAVNAVGGNSSVPSTIIPICADPNHTPPVEAAATAKRVTFLGGLHWPPNAEGILWFAKEVFPKVRAEVPDAVLTVIGKSPPPGLEGVGVEVTGYVPDLNQYLVETAAFIVPLHAGGGMRVKILDAWSWGLPVVSTTIGAEGIKVDDGNDILIADDPQAFAKATVKVLSDKTVSGHLRQNGRNTVIEKYNWEVIYPAWDAIYSGIVEGAV